MVYFGTHWRLRESLPDGRVVKLPSKPYDSNYIKRITNLEMMITEEKLFEVIDDNMIVNIIPVEYILKSTIIINVKKSIL